MHAYNLGVVGSWSVKASCEGDEFYMASSSSIVIFTVVKKVEHSGGIPGYPVSATMDALLVSLMVLYYRKGKQIIQPK